MDPDFLSRLQFALTTSFHFIFPPISMGLGLLLVIVGISTGIITKFFVLPSPQGAATIAAATLYWFHRLKK